MRAAAHDTYCALAAMLAHALTQRNERIEQGRAGVRDVRNVNDRLVGKLGRREKFPQLAPGTDVELAVQRNRNDAPV